MTRVEDDEAVWLTVSEYARIFRVSRQAVRNAIHSGHLPAVRIGKVFRIKINPDDLPTNGH